MSKNYLLASICFVAVILGMVIWNRRKVQPKVLSENAVVEEVRVVLRDDGFDPADVTIKAGTAVRWVNNTSSAQASINSDDYPDNKLYPELNLGKFQKDQSLVHIFNTAGTYTYHDHFNPDRKGTVKVN